MLTGSSSLPDLWPEFVLSSYGRYWAKMDQGHNVLGPHARWEHEHHTQRIDLDVGED